MNYFHTCSITKKRQTPWRVPAALPLLTHESVPTGALQGHDIRGEGIIMRYRELGVRQTHLRVRDTLTVSRHNRRRHGGAENHGSAAVLNGRRRRRFSTCAADSSSTVYLEPPEEPPGTGRASLSPRCPRLCRGGRIHTTTTKKPRGRKKRESHSPCRRCICAPGASRVNLQCGRAATACNRAHRFVPPSATPQRPGTPSHPHPPIQPALPLDATPSPIWNQAARGE